MPRSGVAQKWAHAEKCGRPQSASRMCFLKMEEPQPTWASSYLIHLIRSLLSSFSHPPSTRSG